MVTNTVCDNQHSPFRAYAKQLSIHPSTHPPKRERVSLPERSSPPDAAQTNGSSAARSSLRTAAPAPGCKDADQPVSRRVPCSPGRCHEAGVGPHLRHSPPREEAGTSELLAATFKRRAQGTGRTAAAPGRKRRRRRRHCLVYQPRGSRAGRLGPACRRDGALPPPSGGCRLPLRNGREGRGTGPSSGKAGRRSAATYRPHPRPRNARRGLRTGTVPLRARRTASSP